MPISEADISVLIPTYRYRDKVGRAVESALASGAGEIVVTDDRSGDGTMKLLAGYDDPRLRVYENAQNLGLWENHLAALGHATKPWIKFIQADDYLLPGGLAAYATAVDPGVTVVWGCPIVKDDETGAESRFHDLAAPRRMTGAALLDLCLHVGWLLGSPSHMMLHADAFPRDPTAWDTGISADLVNGAVAAAQGDVVLLPPGAIGQGSHPRQDAKTQGHRLGLQRMLTSAAYLAARPEPELRRFAALWARVNLPSGMHTAMSGVLRGRLGPVEAAAFARRYWTLAGAAPRTAPNQALLRSAQAYRRTRPARHDIDAVPGMAHPLT